MHFFQNFERDSIFEPQQFEKRDKKKWYKPSFTAILDGLLSRQAKIIFFKGIFQ